MAATGYSIHGYSRMLGDKIRIDAYSEALRRIVRPGDTVIDIGASLGYFAVLACKLGAAKVYAIEPDDSIELGRRVAEENGVLDRVEFVQKMSTEFEPGRKANVIVSDLRGVLPLFESHIASIADARARLLAPDGVLIPQSDVIYGAVVESADDYSDCVHPWALTSKEVDLSAVEHFLKVGWYKRSLKQSTLLSDPVALCTLEYNSISSPKLDATATWRTTRSGVAHGLALWFDATLVDDVGFSNAPGKPELIYAQAFFPFPNPVSLTEDTRIEAQIQALPARGDYVWRRALTFRNSSGDLIAEFNQSNFSGESVSINTIRRRRDDYIPPVLPDAEVTQSVLALLDGENTVGAIARAVSKTFPARFPSWIDAMTPILEIIERQRR